MPAFLIIDDSPTLRKMIMAALRPLKVTYGEAASGLEAIEKLTLTDFDAITLDLHMPDMHGLEFLRFLRSHSRFERLPVLVITSNSDPKSRADALAAGANRYITKPFDPAELLTELRSILPELQP